MRLFGLMLLSVIFCSFTSNEKSQILFLMHQGKTTESLRNYLVKKEQDLPLLQEACKILLEKGAQSKEDDVFLMTLYGAGISGYIPILEKGIRSNNPNRQLAALNFLGKMQDDRADKLLLETLSSPFLLARLEAAFQLASKNDADIIELLQSLMVKLPPKAHVLFPQIVSRVETEAATRLLRHFLQASDQNVRQEAISQTAKYHRDELLPQIRSLAVMPDPVCQEACAAALGAFKDQPSFSHLRKLAENRSPTLSLAATKALYELGDQEAGTKIVERAKENDLFALVLVGELRLEEGKEVLVQKLASEDPLVKLNATLSLLLLSDERAMDSLKEILIADAADLGYVAQTSAGKSLAYFKTVPSITHNTKLHPNGKAQTQNVRLSALRATLEMPEDAFLEVAEFLFEKKEKPLIPMLVELLANHKSERAIALLKEQADNNEDSFCAHACALALYRLHEEGDYERRLLRWATRSHNQQLIRLEEKKEEHGPLAPEESSRLLIETFQTLAAAQNRAGIEALVHSIAYGNPKNRYALAGLLIKAAE